jgi:hypothetical protein
MRSSWSLGVVFIALGGLSASGIGGHRPLGPVPWAIAGLLVLAGLFLFTRTRASFFVALAAGAVTTISGILALAHHPELALPVPAALSVGVGLYLIFRTAIASPLLGGHKNKSSFAPPRDEAQP